MHFVRSHIGFINNEQAACAVSEIGSKDKALDKVRPSRAEIVTDREVGSIDAVESGKVCVKRRVILDTVKIGCKDRIIRRRLITQLGQDMSGESGFNGGTVSGTCDVGGGEIMGDQPWCIAGGSKLRIGGNAPDGGKYVAGIVSEGVNGNVAISGFLDGVECDFGCSPQCAESGGASPVKVVERGVQVVKGSGVSFVEAGRCWCIRGQWQSRGFRARATPRK